MILIIQIASLLAAITAQSTLCVWNAKDAFDRFNGEYTLSTTVYQNGYQVWQTSESNSQCSAGSDARIYVIADSYGASYWHIEEELRQNFEGWAGTHPTCKTATFPSNPGACGANWYSYGDLGAWSGIIAMTVTDGSCPTLICDRMQVISPSQNTGCDAIFQDMATKDYVWYTLMANNNIRYLYFNRYQFKWYCSDDLGINDCGDDSSITHQEFSAVNDVWNYVSEGESFSISIENAPTNQILTVQFNCLDTLSPTFSPTVAPTDSPTISPTPAPTNAPTDSPTPAPTAPPTPAPTESPTKAPTQPPTTAPTQPPTKAPTWAPTEDTDDPTLAPTAAPTDSTKTPTAAPTIAPSTAPTFAPTSTWSHCAHDSECEYISKITMVILYDSALAFEDYLATLKGKSSIANAAKEVAREVLATYVSAANILTSTQFAQTGSSLTLTAMAGTNKISKMRTLFYDVASQDVAYAIQPLIAAYMNEEQAGSEFIVTYISGAIVLTTPDKWPEDIAIETKGGGSSAAMLLWGLVSGGIVLLVVTVNVVICAVIFYRFRSGKDNGGKNWMPHHLRGTVDVLSSPRQSNYSDRYSVNAWEGGHVQKGVMEVADDEDIDL